MYLIFERYKGRFKSNCNILSLAWTPYYQEAQFRQALIDYHQRQPLPEIRPNQNNANNNQQHPTESNNSNTQPPNRIPRLASANNGYSSNNQAFLNLRLAQQYHRYIYINNRPSDGSATSETISNTADPSTAIADSPPIFDGKSWAMSRCLQMNNELDVHYGRMSDFGWLAIGNIGKMVGITLTSIVSPPIEIDTNRSANRRSRSDEPDEDLIVLNDQGTILGAESSSATSQRRPTEWSEYDAANGQMQPHYDQLRPDRKCVRANYNLRGHLDEIILIRWNELYQKLATVDSKGNVLIWCKVNEKFTIHTPFYNRAKSVADFKWSNNGKTALICYTDSFILVGSSSVQRHWHSMLNLSDYHITCASWTPNDEHLLLGVSNGNVVVIDLPQNELTELVVGETNIRTMCWSSSEMNLRHLAADQKKANCDQMNWRPTTDGRDSHQSRARGANVVVSHRRLSRDSMLFSRYRMCSQGPSGIAASSSSTSSSSSSSSSAPPLATHGPQQQQQQQQQQRQPTVGCLSRALNGAQGGQSQVTSQRHSERRSESMRRDFLTEDQRNILAIDFANNTVKLFDGGLEAAKQREIQVGLESYLMAWSSDGLVLAVAGFNLCTSASTVGCIRCKYLNAIKFYTQDGDLIHERKLPWTRYPITALTWAHEDQRLFIATGPRLHCARVFMGVPKLSLLASSILQQYTKYPSKSDILNGLFKLRNKTRAPEQPLELLDGIHTIKNWQSYNCPLDLDSIALDSSSKQVADCTAGQVTLTAKMASPEHQESPAMLGNNVNIGQYRLPAKLKFAVDQLFTKTISQSFSEQLTPNDIAWLVPRCHQRTYCTLICYSHELADLSCGGGASAGPQYKSHELLDGPSGMQISSDEFKIFVLYLECQGSLIPILKARRIGFMKPEFVIFDPDETAAGRLSRRLLKVGDVAKAAAATSTTTSSRAANPSRLQHFQLTPDSCDSLHTNLSPPNYLFATTSSSFSPSPSPLSSIPAPPNKRTEFNGAHSRAQYHRHQASAGERPRAPVANQWPPISSSRVWRDPTLISDLIADMNLMATERGARNKPRLVMTPAQRFALEHLERLISSKPAAPLEHSARNNLPESRELVHVRSNIWGTEFKLINVGNQMIAQRALLGLISYEANIFRHQPRQVLVRFKDMSNYCALCSLHHHTNPHGHEHNTKTKSFRHSYVTPKCGEGKPSCSDMINLIDLPIESTAVGQLGNFQLPLKAWPSATNRRALDRRIIGNSNANTDKVFLPVGDILRVAPRLESNQRYKFGSARHNSASCSAQGEQLGPSTRRRQRGATRALRERQQPHQFLTLSSKSQMSTPEVHTCRPPGTVHQLHDDVLTLSLDPSLEAEHRVQMELSCDRRAEVGARGKKKDDFSNDDILCRDNQLDHFLKDNKTLKSIQTITRMIADLSSRANEAAASASDESARVDLELHSSPRKIIKIQSQELPESIGGAHTRSPAWHYEPPETPVHRPRHLTSATRAALSATSTPLAERRLPAASSRSDHLFTNLGDAPLPPPPPAMPLRRRLSGSIKRLFDGSMRSLTGVTAGYTSASEDLSAEDCELLMASSGRLSRSRQRSHVKQSAPNVRHQSQPATPLRLFSDGRRGGGIGFDLGQLKQQLSERLGSNLNQAIGHANRAPSRRPTRSSSLAAQKTDAHHALQAHPSCTRRSRWVHQKAGSTASPTAHRSSASMFSSSGSSSSDLSLDSSIERSSTTTNGSNVRAFLDQSIARVKNRLGGRSARSFNDLTDQLDPQETRLKFVRHLEANDLQSDRLAKSAFEAVRKRRQRRGRQRRRTRKQSICRNATCCCAQEFRLNNKPPVWNELSQVYQLDFGGRVIQESAKNLQIDFEGRLALQFGRLDNCTYTLDYEHPFNAIQAMAVALASLTRRLK